MPTYEYACRGCGEHLEVVQSFRDEPLTTCPACGGELRKVFGAIGIAFKGSGFYRTDNRVSGDGDTTKRAGTKPEAAAGGDGGKASGDSGSTTAEPPKKDSKPAPTSDSKAAASS